MRPWLTRSIVLFLSFAGTTGPTGIAGVSGATSQAVAQTVSGSQAPATTPVAEPATEGVRFAGPGEGLEAAISGLEYRLGPGDGLVVGIWSPQPTLHEVVVSLEGDVLIPTVGTVNVSGDFLDDAKKKIRGMILRSFRDVDVTVSLSQLRRFQIHVLGQVGRPGTYLATAVDRASSAIGWARGFSADANRRRVLLLNHGEVRAEADLVLFQGRGILDENPLLRDGDVVFVPFAGQSFSVLGAVNAPGAFPVRAGDRLSDALLLAGGAQSEAQMDTIEVARYFENRSAPVRFFAVAGGGLFAERESERDLLPSPLEAFRPADLGLEYPEELSYSDFEVYGSDLIFVRAIPAGRRKRLVEVAGEVTYPGKYAIREGETRISDVVAMAGGLTTEAFLSEAKLIRQEAIRLEDREFERLKLIPPADMTEDEYEYFKVRARENPGQMVVDFHALFERDEASQNILVRRGDLIEIPSRRDFVSVIGLVQNPGNVFYRPGFSAGDYIRESGGYSEDADKGKTRVIRAEGGEWVSLGEVDELHRGDTVWIPEKGKGKFWSTFRDVITVTTQILTIYLIADRAVDSR